ncbi:MAG: hypothetical protein AAF456_01625 [Planctomycetota bacterium]
MSDLRYDPVTGVWVTIARNRLDRPSEYVPLEQVRQQLICPFCRGNEEETPTTIIAYFPDGKTLGPSDDKSDWAVRVVPNKFPSFTDSIHRLADTGPWQISSGTGAQELIIPSSRHLTSFSELSDDEVRVTFQAAQQRISAMNADDSIQHAMLFQNCRAAAGASLGHVHLQLIGSPIVSGHLMRRVDRDLNSRLELGSGLLDRITRWELEQDQRVILRTENFAAYCPFASRFAFQVWIVPDSSEGGFARCDSARRDELAELCREVISRFENQLDNPSYNWLLHIPPFKEETNERADYWYLELFPRLTSAAGYEMGTNTWVNPVTPEAAARRLR